MARAVDLYYLAIELADIEILGTQVFADRAAALAHFDQCCAKHSAHEFSVDDLAREIPGTIAAAGDDSYSIAIVERSITVPVDGANLEPLVLVELGSANSGTTCDFRPGGTACPTPALARYRPHPDANVFTNLCREHTPAIPGSYTSFKITLLQGRAIRNTTVVARAACEARVLATAIFFDGEVSENGKDPDIWQIDPIEPATEQAFIATINRALSHDKWLELLFCEYA